MSSSSRATAVHDVLNTIDTVNNYRLGPKAKEGKTEHNVKKLPVHYKPTTAIMDSRWGYVNNPPTRSKPHTFDTGVENLKVVISQVHMEFADQNYSQAYVSPCLFQTGRSSRTGLRTHGGQVPGAGHGQAQ